MPKKEVLLLLALAVSLPVGAQGTSSALDIASSALDIGGVPVVAGLPQSEPLPAPVELTPEFPQFRPSATVAEAFAASQSKLKLQSAVALVIDQEDGQLLYAKNTDAVMPIASITKLMTAVVVLDAKLPLDEPITITREDVDTLKGTRSRLKLGVTLPRRDLLRLALMASENRAAAALARTHPGGSAAFIQAMNQRAREFGMSDTRFVDSTGLDPDNVATAVDLAILVHAGYRYPLIREFTTQDSHRVAVDSKKRRYRTVAFRNSNGLVRSGKWDIGLSKTGYISEAGRCLVMQARIAAKPVIIVLLDSWGKFTRIGDANRIKQWIERLEDGMPPAARRSPRIM
jgi:D-alanyl-D-alanine endopeptidase (penicillin-binding protein 7)